MAREVSAGVRPGAWRHHRLGRAGMIVVILAPAAAALFFAGRSWPLQDSLKLGAVIVMSLFLPLLAYSFFFFREERRVAELDRIFTKLDLEDEATYVKMFREVRSGPSFCLAVGLVWTISLAGLMILFLGEKIGSDRIKLFDFGDGQTFPIEGSRLVFGMAFLGAYIWGLQYTFRRYVVNDLIPGVFYSLGIRMLMAASLALLIYNAFAPPPGGEADGSGSPLIPATVWPALAFLVGAFPQRGLQWLMARIPIFSAKPDPSVRPLTLDMIEGIGNYDKMRLEELGIESCHDLANADFIPLVLKTSYGARELTDWILQAKLFVVCGESVKDLRQHGVRSIIALADLEQKEILDLARQTSASESSLKRAKEYAARDPDIARLRFVAGRLGEYTSLPKDSGTETEEK